MQTIIVLLNPEINDLSLSAQIYISEKDTDDLENCVLVFPK